MNKDCAVLFPAVVVTLAILTGCETVSKNMVLYEEGRDARAALKGLLPTGALPSTARNVHAYMEHWPVGSLLIGCFDARTEELEEILDESPHFPMRRQFFESGKARDWLLKERPFLTEKCPWWKPEEAVCFGMVSVVKHYFDRFDGESKPRKFYTVTNYYAGLREVSSGRSLMYIMVVWNEPEQE